MVGGVQIAGTYIGKGFLIFRVEFDISLFSIQIISIKYYYK